MLANSNLPNDLSNKVMKLLSEFEKKFGEACFFACMHARRSRRAGCGLEWSASGSARA